MAEDFVWAPPRLYRVELGMGYLELPQTTGVLERSVLATRNVYILDAHQDLFVWSVLSVLCLKFSIVYFIRVWIPFNFKNVMFSSYFNFFFLIGN